jgi:hypothetical protein
VTQPTSNYLRRQIGLICNDQICDRQNELFEDAAMESAGLFAGTTLACRIPRHDPLKTKIEKATLFIHKKCFNYEVGNTDCQPAKPNPGLGCATITATTSIPTAQLLVLL